MEKKTLLLRDIKRIIKKDFKRLILTAILMSFLFYLFNIFTGLSLKLDKISDAITDKVGIYFYIQDSEETKDEIYKRIIDIKDTLWNQGIKVDFSSKDDAFNYLEDKIPEITKNFDKFGIENPLPSTLYVMFNNQKEYNIMKNIIIANKDIILNIKDIDKWATLVQQENRSLKIINIMNIIRNSFYFIMVMLTIIIITFTQHILKHFFYEFYKEIEIKRLLWATQNDANWWFLLTLLSTISIWFIIWFILTYVTFNILNHHLLSINIDLSLCSIIPKLLVSYILFTIISLWLWYNMLKTMEKKF